MKGKVNMQENSNLSLIEMDQWEAYSQQLFPENRDQFTKDVGLRQETMESEDEVKVKKVDRALETIKNNFLKLAGVPIKLMKHTLVKVKKLKIF